MAERASFCLLSVTYASKRGTEFLKEKEELNARLPTVPAVIAFESPGAIHLASRDNVLLPPGTCMGH